MRNLLATCAVAVAVTAGTLFAPAPAQAWGYRHFGFYRPYVHVYRPYAYYRPFYRHYAFYRPYRAYASVGFGRPHWLGWRHRWR